MASALKEKLQSATGGGGHTANEEEVEKYKLLVTAGPSYDLSRHETVNVNQDDPVYVENDFVRCKVNVRVRGFKGRGLPSASPASSPYFDNPLHEKDQYSIGFSFVPKQDIPSVDTVWGNDFDHKISTKLPPGFNTAFKIVKEFIDPGLSCDAYADEPWLYGPSLSCWFAFRIGGKIRPGADFKGPGDRDAMREGGDGSGQDVRSGLGIPDSGDRRRKHFLDAHHREKFVFEKDRLYEADFYNPYIDFPNFSLKLPGFSLKVIKKTGDMYLNVNFRLLWGEQLQQALKKDQEPRQAALKSGPPAASGTIGQTEHPSSEPTRRPRTSDSDVEGPLLGPAPAVTERDAHPNNDMRLHPGDQSAAENHDTGAEVIARMLKNTSTRDKTGTHERLLSSDVD
ncbi:hypothetical protein LTR53_000597 [Teratosphaeriaceae sp. CCFEE 6253]|nr:hypothetical protein LTR53_000597 [Teratosphaeriaceae sp. CCFEE 6253]